MLVVWLIKKVIEVATPDPNNRVAPAPSPTDVLYQPKRAASGYAHADGRGSATTSPTMSPTMPPAIGVPAAPYAVVPVSVAPASNAPRADYYYKYGVGSGQRELEGKHFFKVFQMATDTDARRVGALSMTVSVSATLFIVGCIFLGLCAGGVYPTTVVNQKLLGEFSIGIAKYCIYIVAGILGMLGGWLGGKAVAARTSVALSASLIIVAVLAALATMGMTLYNIKQEATSPYYTAPWWSWLIIALILIQRLIFLMVCTMGVVTLREAKADMATAGELPV